MPGGINVVLLSVLLLSMAGTGVAYADEQQSSTTGSLQGLWRVTAVESGGKTATEHPYSDRQLLVRGSRLSFAQADVLAEYQADTSVVPQQIDIPVSEGGKPLQGIYRLADGVLTLCLADTAASPRPRDFSTRGTKHVLLTMQSVQPSDLQQLSAPPEKLEIRHSQLGYRSTLAFYSFADARAILVLRVGNGDESFPVQAAVHLFSPELPAADMRKWINNQHSDGLFFDAPKPEKTIELAVGSCPVTVAKQTGTSTNPGPVGGEYRDFSVRVVVQGRRVTDAFSLPSFSDSLRVHVAGKPVAVKN